MEVNSLCYEGGIGTLVMQNLLLVLTQVIFNQVFEVILEHCNEQHNEIAVAIHKGYQKQMVSQIPIFVQIDRNPL